jgi:hypothetical protein
MSGIHQKDAKFGGCGCTAYRDYTMGVAKFWMCYLLRIYLYVYLWVSAHD